MIRIGFDFKEKQKIINEYVKKNKIKKAYILYFKKFEQKFNLKCDNEYLEWSDIIEYEPFYRLVKEIDKDCLVVVNECMRTQNRSELTYNCIRHYCNQGHVIVFEWFPIIEELGNIMTMIDFDTQSRHKGFSFDTHMLDDIDIKCVPRIPELNIIKAQTTKEQLKEYEEEKDKLFDNLGKKHPDTISTNLELFVGNFKKDSINPGKNYVARNARFKKDNVQTFKDTKDANLIMLDYPIRQIELNDYMKKTETSELSFVSSGTKVDLYYIEQYKKFKEEAEKIYAKTSI